jgi:hypothetical protein
MKSIKRKPRTKVTSYSYEKEWKPKITKMLVNVETKSPVPQTQIKLSDGGNKLEHDMTHAIRSVTEEIRKRAMEYDKKLKKSFGYYA